MTEQSSIYIFTSVLLGIMIIYFAFALYSLRERKVEFGPDTKIEIMEIPRGATQLRRAALYRDASPNTREILKPSTPVT